MGDTVTVERPEGISVEVWSQATQMAEAIVPQLHPAIDARVSAAVKRMQEETAQALGIAGGLAASRLRPPSGASRDPRPFATFGDNLKAIVDSSKRGASGIHQGLLDIHAATGMNESIGADGGFLVQTDYADGLVQRVNESGLVWGRISDSRKMPASPNSNKRSMPAVDETSRADGSRFGGVRGYWTAEGGTITASRPKFGKIDLELNGAHALTYMTNEELEDTPYLEALVGGMHVEEIAFKLDDALVNGDGSGKPLGILNSGALVSQAKEAGQAARTIVAENVINMWSRLWARSRPNAVWFINQQCEPQLLTMSIAVGTGGVPIYMPANGISGLPYSTLFGRPVVPIEQCPTLGTIGDIILADMNEYWALVKGGVKQALSIHVAFTTDEAALRTSYRVDAQPMWKSALTPFKDATTTQTLSPFVALATRA